MRLDISAGDTSMNRRNEKQLPLSSPKTVKMKTVNTKRAGGERVKSLNLLTFPVKKRLLDVICREGRQQHLKNSEREESHRFSYCAKEYGPTFTLVIAAIGIIALSDTQISQRPQDTDFLRSCISQCK